MENSQGFMWPFVLVIFPTVGLCLYWSTRYYLQVEGEKIKKPPLQLLNTVIFWQKMLTMAFCFLAIYHIGQYLADQLIFSDCAFITVILISILIEHRHRQYLERWISSRTFPEESTT